MPAPQTANVQVRATVPGIFTFNAQGSGAGALEHAVTYQLVTDSNPVTVLPPVASGSAAPGPSQTVWPMWNFPFCRYSGKGYLCRAAPGFAGLYQVNAEVAQGTPAGEGLQITSGGVASNTVTLAVR